MGTVQYADAMLFGADKFNQDINGWNVESMTRVELFLKQGTIMALAENEPCWLTYNPNVEVGDEEFKWTITNDYVAVCAAPPPTPPPVTTKEPKTAPLDGVLSDSTIRYAVEAWLDDAAAAEAEWGPINGWNTEEVTDFSYLFRGATTFNDAIGSWNTNSGTTMKGMFYKAKAFNRDISGWNLGGVTDVSRMFAQAEAFNQPVNTWRPAALMTVNQMFSAATAFDQSVDGIDFSRVVDFSFMFSGCTHFNQDLTSMDVAAGVDFSHMFAGAASFDSSLSGWDMTSAEDLTGMFKSYGASAFNQPLVWDITNVRLMAYMFVGCNKFDQDLDDWTPDGVEDSGALDQMFKDATIMAGKMPCWTSSFSYEGVDYLKITNDYVAVCAMTTTLAPITTEPPEATAPPPGASHTDTSIRAAVKLWFEDEAGATEKYGAIATWITTDVTDMSFLFKNRANFNGDITGWDLANVVTTKGMFKGCKSFTRDISGWSMSANQNMARMFSGATAFNVDIGGWSTGSVTSMAEMFADAKAFNQDIGRWNTGAVTDMYFMFSGAVMFNQDLNSWNVASVTDFSYMFAAAESYNSPMDQWATGSATAMVGMFKAFGASVFNQNVGSFDVSKVSTIEGMFHGANAFDHPLSDWNVVSMIDNQNMFAPASTIATPCWSTSDKTRIGVFERHPNWKIACVDLVCRKIPGTWRGGRKVGNANVRQHVRTKEYDTCLAP